MQISVDINSDMGESFGAYRIGRDDEIIRYISSSNIACGFHASDPNTMEKTVRLCQEHKVGAGAHPGYPDLCGFGRRSMDMDRAELVHSILYQVGALQAFLSLHKIPLQHVKMHGALYNDLVNREALYLDIITQLQAAFGKVVFLTLSRPQSSLLKKKMKKKFRIALEVFPDRNYTDEGELLSRKHKEAVLKDPDVIAARALRMVREKGIESVNGRWVDLDIDTLCLHGDNLESIEAARKIRELFKKEGIQVKPLGSLL